jgi:hypothetical protein
MQFLLLFACLSLFSVPLQATEVDVDITGGVYCVHDMKKVATAKVHGHQVVV